MHRSSRFLCDGQCSGVYHRHMISARAIKEQVAFSYSLLLLLVMVCACMQVYVRRAECVSVGCGVGTFRVLLLQLLLCRRHCGHVTDLRLVLSFPLLLLLHGTSMIVDAAAVVDVVSADVCRRSRDRCRHL